MPGCQMPTGASHVLRWVNGKHSSPALRVILPPALTLCMQQLYKKPLPLLDSPTHARTHAMYTSRSPMQQYHITPSNNSQTLITKELSQPSVTPPTRTTAGTLYHRRVSACGACATSKHGARVRTCTAAS